MEYLFLYLLEDNKQNGNDKEQGDGAYEHTANGTYAERAVAVGTDTCCQGERQQTEDHGH